MALFDLIPTLLRPESLNILLNIIIGKYLFDSDCIMLVSDKSLDLRLNLIYTVIHPSKYIDEFTSQLLEVSDGGCSDYVVQMENPKEFMIAFNQVTRLEQIKNGNRRIVIAPVSENESNYTEKAIDLLAMKEAGFVANILMIIPSEGVVAGCKSYSLFTHEFLKPEGNKPIFLDSWNSCTQRFLRNADLFPQTITDLKGKHLKVACFSYKPYVILDIDPSIVPSGRDGLDIRILETFCNRVNCTIQLIRDDKTMWGGINNKEGTGTGILGLVYRDEADVAITGLFPWYNESVVLDLSASYIRTAVICVAPSSRPLSGWTVPLMPFEFITWSAVSFTFFIACFGLTLANKSTHHVILLVFGIMLNQSQKLGYSWRSRGVTGWVLLTGWVIGTAYDAGLATTYTLPRHEPSIDTVKDLIDRNMEWGANDRSIIYSLELSDEPMVKKLVSLFKVYPNEELKKRTFKRDMAFSIEKLPAGTYAINDYITSDALLGLTIMTENLYYEHCVMMFRKDSPYVKKMSILIDRLHETGILLAWEIQITLKYLNYTQQQEIKHSRSNNKRITKSLKLNDVKGIFVLHIVCIVLCTFVFIGEIIMFNLKSESAV